MKKETEIRVSTVPFRFQTWSLCHALEVLTRMFNMTEAEGMEITAAYGTFLLSDSLSSFRSYSIGGEPDYMVSIEFKREA